MITAIVLTKNEEKNLESCLNSLLWCDEIIIVDDYSTDNTKQISKKFGAKIITRALDGDFAAQRNASMAHVKQGWILFVDADERVSNDMQMEVAKKIKKSDAPNAFKVKRVDYMWGKMLTHGDTGNTWLVRLAKANAGVWEGKVHERWNISGSVENLHETLLHYPHPNIESFLRHINQYSSIRSSELIAAKRVVSIIEVIIGPLWKFKKNYIFKLGILDGTAGCIHAMMMAMYTYLVASKTYLAQHSSHADNQ